MRVFVFMLAFAMAVVAVVGCGETEVTPPQTVSRAGFRVLLPEGADSLEWVRIELWHDNHGVAITPPNCPDPVPTGDGISFSSASDDPPDGCGTWQVEIWDIRGERVRFIPEMNFRGRAYVWDGLDDSGSPVSHGLYVTRQRCLDGGGGFRFDGHYYFHEGVTWNCQWVLWKKVIVPAETGLAVEYDNFPYVIVQDAINRLTDEPDEVILASPFTIKVIAPGFFPFAEDINLINKTVTEVTVELLPFQEK